MPAYHYKCDNCEYEFELVHSIKKKAKKKCPECKKYKLNRVLYPCYGIVCKSLNQMPTIIDYARKKKDKLTLWEKENYDKSYAESSTLAEQRLNESKVTPAYKSKNWKKIMKMTDSQKAKYIKSGETPSD